MLMKPILRGKLVLTNNPVKKNPIHPNIEIKKPIDAAVPIDLFIVYPTNFNIGTFIIAPPIPIKEETKPTIKPNVVLWNKLNLSFNFVLSFKKNKLIANKYRAKLKKRIKNLVFKYAAIKDPITTPITTNIP